MSTSLEMKRIQKWYGKMHVVRDFDLQVEAGEFLTFLGPSGSGKSTALKIIAGFEPTSSGEILLGDKPITDVPPYERGIGMVFQNYALFPHMTVEENVAFPLTVRRSSRADTRQKVDRALRLVKMEEYRSRYPSQLSGGQQQRIALARAIVFDPSVLLMDEPLGALDRNLREHMKIEIMRIQKELNMTVIFVTHDQDEALTMSDRIAVIDQGGLVQLADSNTLYNQPNNRFIASFVGESNLLPCAVGAVSGEFAKVTLPGNSPGLARLPSGRADAAKWLFVRPEHVDISDSECAARPENCLHGTVEQCLFLGESTRYIVRCADEVITLKQQNRGQFKFPEGSSVKVSWKAADCRLLE